MTWKPSKDIYATERFTSVAMAIPWRRGSPRTGCCDSSRAACSSSASGCQGYWCSASWLWSCVDQAEAPLVTGNGMKTIISVRIIPHV